MNKRKHLKKTFKKIRKVFPRAENINIDVKKLPDGQFNTKLEVKAKRKNLFASKIDKTYVDSLDRSYQAIKKQIDKIRWKKAVRTKLEFNI
jgi:ribosome-associated translation inhibitor RaiA